jgi:hypothetical protein
VHPEPVEAVLSACPGAGEVAVTARADERWGLRLVALFTGEIAPATLDAWAREHLPSASRPREFLRVDAAAAQRHGQAAAQPPAGLVAPTRNKPGSDTGFPLSAGARRHRPACAQTRKNSLGRPMTPRTRYEREKRLRCSFAATLSIATVPGLANSLRHRRAFALRPGSGAARGNGRRLAGRLSSGGGTSWAR